MLQQATDNRQQNRLAQKGLEKRVGGRFFLQPTALTSTKQIRLAEYDKIDNEFLGRMVGWSGMGVGGFVGMGREWV